MAAISGHLLAGRYRTLKRLGSGGMATVLLAEDERLGRQVAVKRMHSESPEEVAKRFNREAQLGASLNHPNIVSVYDIETDDENVLIVMEYVPGGTLKDALARGPLPREATFKVLRGVAAALDYAHEHDIVHRDVKPANVLLDGDGRAKLADLGIATAAEVTSITNTGAVLGTAAYMPPERLDGHRGGKEADIYALATVAYETLTGHKARQGRSAVEVAAMVMSEPPPDLRVHVPDAPEAAVRVLERGMARDPSERPPSAGEFVRELCLAFDEADEPESSAPPAEASGSALGAAAADTDGADTDGTPAAAPAPTYRRQRASGGRRAAAPVGRSEDAPDRRWLLPVAGLVLALLAIGAVLALTGGGDSGGDAGSDRAHESGDVRGQSSNGGDSGDGGGSSAEGDGSGAEGGSGEAAPGGSGQGGGGQGGGGSGGADPGGGGGADAPPARAVEQFYKLAADDDFERAWELAGPGARRQLGGFETFKATLRTLESIEFRTLEVQEQTGSMATVRLRTVATHTDKVDRCRGTARTASSGGRWRIERLNVRCTEG